MRIELLNQGQQQGPTLRVDRAFTTKEVVVFGDFLDSLLRNVFAAKDVFEEGDHVVGLFRPTKGDQQQGVVGLAHATDSWSNGPEVAKKRRETERESPRVPSFPSSALRSDPNGIRTRIAALKGP